MRPVSPSPSLTHTHTHYAPEAFVNSFPFSHRNKPASGRRWWCREPLPYDPCRGSASHCFPLFSSVAEACVPVLELIFSTKFNYNPMSPVHWSGRGQRENPVATLLTHHTFRTACVLTTLASQHRKHLYLHGKREKPLQSTYFGCFLGEFASSSLEVSRKIGS